jgi:hypothetical protein
MLNTDIVQLMFYISARTFQDIILSGLNIITPTTEVYTSAILVLFLVENYEV